MTGRKSWRTLGVLLAIAGLVAAEFLAHRSVPFMMDDLWYGTNLATEEPLGSLADVVESMVWHFQQWGGRCMTHAVLQLTLMSGELCADFLNVLTTLLLTLMVCIVIEKKSLPAFLLIHCLLFSWNANLKMSMLWQAGAANYVYSSLWILVFLWPYLRKLGDGERRALPFAGIWLAPIGLLAGWSNENMGPACFLAAVGTVIYTKAFRKKPIEGWMLSGMVSSLLGSVLVVAAPGNFVRSAILEKQTIFDRLLSMLTAGVDFLFPSFLFVVAVLLIKGVCLKQKIGPVQWALLIIAVLSYGAMVLSPHYPDRATFGSMVICIALVVSALSDIVEQKPQWKPLLWGMTICFWVCAMASLLLEVYSHG